MTYSTKSKQLLVLFVVIPSILLTLLTRAFAMTLPDNTIELIHGNGAPTHAVIWLHGLGASANDFPPIVPELGLSNDRVIRFIFPQAPDRAITINGGMRMPGWYDIKGISIEDKQDAVGMAESRDMLDQIVEGQIASGIASENIILAGFSQGGAVTYFTGVRSKRKLAGLLTLSTYLPFDQDTKAEQSGVNIDTPIFASHGTNDGVVPLSMGKSSVDTLTQLGYSISWKTYPMEHQVSMQQIQAIGIWINQVFSKQ
ncbi:MAG: phospholipase/carboxylesterase [Arenicella sp.]